MTAIIKSVFSVEAYPSRANRLKALFLYTLVTIIIGLAIPVGIIGVSTGAIVSPLIPSVIVLTLMVVYGLVRAGYLLLASRLFILISLLGIVGNNLIDGSVGSLTLLLNIFLLIMAGFLAETPGIIVITISSVLQVFAFPIIGESLETGFATRIPLAIVYVAVGAVVYAYNRFVIASRLEGQDLESQERLKLADVNMRITRQASARESMDNALNTTLDLILENYPDIYHAQVFLIDTDGIQARLVASTGEAGQRLIERAHSLAVGSLSVIGQTTLTGEAVVARPSDKDSVHRVNELLPLTKLEAAFPLLVGEEIIGALDLQSQVLEDLDANDRLSFQSLANSLSLSIDSIRQFEQAKARVEENQRLTEQTRTALREVERLNRRLIGRAWSDYVKGPAGSEGIAVDFMDDSVSALEEWTDTLAEAVQSKNLVQEGNVLAVPLRVRGQIVGAMEFELEDNQDFTPEDLELITEVSERFGLAAENTRLVEESQRSAQRAMLINQMTGRFQSAQDVEATLAEAARSLSDTLNAGKVMIRLGVPEKPVSRKED